MGVKGLVWVQWESRVRARVMQRVKEIISKIESFCEKKRERRVREGVMSREKNTREGKYRCGA